MVKRICSDSKVRQDTTWQLLSRSGTSPGIRLIGHAGVLPDDEGKRVVDRHARGGEELIKDGNSCAGSCEQFRVDRGTDKESVTGVVGLEKEARMDAAGCVPANTGRTMFVSSAIATRYLREE